MKQEYKNFGYMLAGVVIATMLLNPTFASQISSNLVKGFVAITSSDVKAENNLVGLDAGGKLPIDVIPAEASTSGDGLLYEYNVFTTDRDRACPNGWERLFTDKGTANFITTVYIKQNSLTVFEDGCLYAANDSDWYGYKQGKDTCYLITCLRF